MDKKNQLSRSNLGKSLLGKSMGKSSLGKSKLGGSLIRNSMLGKSQRNNKVQMTNSDMEEAKILMNNALKASYFGMRSSIKPRKDNQHQQIFEDKNISIISQQSEEQEQNQINYPLIITNMIPDTWSFSCQSCCGNETQFLCTLQHRFLEAIQFQKELKNAKKYFINFDTIEAKLEYQEKNISCNQMLLTVGEAKFLLHHAQKKYCDQWFKKLKSAINNSYGKKYYMAEPISLAVRYISEPLFTKQCNTGDILLFRGSHLGAQVQRKLTNSDFDHVGMIVRDNVFGILIFEATTIRGVTLTPWKMVIKYQWYTSIQRLVWRQLQDVQRTKQFENLVHAFVKQTLHKKYYISLEKLLSNQSYIGVSEEEKGYYCSELIAAVYKDLQLLTRDPKHPDYIPSSSIIPYHFTEKADMQLLMGSLGHEYQIHFSKPLLDDLYKQK